MNKLQQKKNRAGTEGVAKTYKGVTLQDHRGGVTERQVSRVIEKEILRNTSTAEAAKIAYRLCNILNLYEK